MNKLFSKLYDWEKTLLTKISNSLSENDKKIFDYQINQYNRIDRNNFANEYYFYYMGFFKVRKLERNFSYNEKPKILSEFELISDEKIINGKAFVVNGRFFMLKFNKDFDYKRIYFKEIKILS